MKLNRRNFVSGAVALGFLQLLGAQNGPSDDDILTIVDYEIDEDMLVSCLTMTGCHVVDSKLVAEVSFDSERAMSVMTFISDTGKRYTYQEVEALTGGL